MVRSGFTLLMLAGAACGGGRVDPGFYGVVEKAPAQDRENVTSQDASAVVFARPKLVEIRADWCPYCNRAQPAVDAALEKFRGRVDLVVLDVTDDDTTVVAERTAKTEGVEVFFRAYRGRTPTIGLFVAPGEGGRVHGDVQNPETLAAAMDYAVEQFAARQRVSSR